MIIMSQDQDDNQADNQIARPVDMHQAKHEDLANATPATDVFAAIDDYMNSTEVPESDLESVPGSTPGVMPDSHAAPDREASAASRPMPGATAPADAREPLPNAGSMALSQIPKERRPRPSTVCEVCPASLWTASPHDVQCWCRIMHFTSWSTNAPYQRIACDGIAIATDQA
jgi:hypothetical protein